MMAKQKTEEPKIVEEQPTESISEKFSDKIESLKKNEKVEQLYRYAKTNTADTIAYILMIVGIVLVYFRPPYGGVLVGIVAGLYFSTEIVQLITSLGEVVERNGMVRSLILGGLLLTFFIVNPWVFIGAALAAGIKHILFKATINHTVCH